MKIDLLLPRNLIMQIQDINTLQFDKFVHIDGWRVGLFYGRDDVGLYLFMNLILKFMA